MRALDSDRYKWIALVNATLAVLLATLDGSITIIAMPDIFRGIHLDPLVPANSFYLLWMILGYLVVTSVLIVSLGRLGDMVGRVKIYRQALQTPAPQWRPPDQRLFLRHRVHINRLGYLAQLTRCLEAVFRSSRRRGDPGR